MSTAKRLRDAIEPNMGPKQTIVLDLSGVEFMDSSCLSVLVQARGTLTADGGSLILRNPSQVAHRVLSLTGIEFILAEDAEDHAERGHGGDASDEMGDAARQELEYPSDVTGEG